MTIRHATLAVAFAFVGLNAPAAIAQDASQTNASDTQDPQKVQSLRLATGISYSKGDYGEIAATEVVAVPVSLTWRSGPLKLRVSVPYVRVDGPGSLIVTPIGRDSGGGGGSGPGSSNSGSGSGSSGSGSGGGSVEVEDDDEVVDGGGTAPGITDNHRSGIGDVSLFASYSVDLGGDFYLEPAVKLKVPTASRSKRLGTGKVDVTPSLDLIKDIGDVSLYLHGRRKFAGKPAGSALRSTWGAGAGASVRARDGLYLGADYDWQESPFAGRQASSELTGWVNLRLARGISLTAYAGAGLNANSADFLGGTSLSFRF